MQERTGEREAALRNGALIGAAIPPRALPFLAEQRLLALGSIAEEGSAWASVWFGARGFVSSADGGLVVIDRTGLEASGEDAVWRNLRAGVDVGLLAIELESRRRLRINGVVQEIDDARIEVGVREAYPNCPKYIQRRHVAVCPGSRTDDAQPVVCDDALDAIRTGVIARADTL